MTHTVTVVPGDGIGPAITDATIHILEAAGGGPRVGRARARPSSPGGAGRDRAEPPLLAACLMLDHLGLGETATRIRDAVRAVVTQGATVTRDVGGSESTKEYAEAVIRALELEETSVETSRSESRSGASAAEATRSGTDVEAV